ARPRWRNRLPRTRPLGSRWRSARPRAGSECAHRDPSSARIVLGLPPRLQLLGRRADRDRPRRAVLRRKRQITGDRHLHDLLQQAGLEARSAAGDLELQIRLVAGVDQLESYATAAEAGLGAEQ